MSKKSYGVTKTHVATLIGQYENGSYKKYHEETISNGAKKNGFVKSVVENGDVITNGIIKNIENHRNKIDDQHFFLPALDIQNLVIMEKQNGHQICGKGCGHGPWGYSDCNGEYLTKGHHVESHKVAPGRCSPIILSGWDSIVYI